MLSKSTLKKHNPHDYLIKSVTLLSTGEELSFERTNNAMTVFANKDFESRTPICFKMEIE